MQRSNSLARGKRALDTSSTDADGQPPSKRPALASVIVEALKVDSLQKLCSSLEPLLRKVVSEEVERALAKLGTPRLATRVSPRRIEGPDGRNLQLQFRTRLSLPLFTGGKVEGEHGTAIHIVLIDANTGRAVTSGPESSVKLDIMVLEGDFNNEDDENWSEEDFERYVVKEREGKRPLLNGELQISLKEGVGTLGELTFTDNSSWIRSRKFRLGLKVATGYCEGIRIREAKTEAFGVKDHRGELYKKHYPPALTDEVWRLEKIGKDGSFHKRLNAAGINSVEDFLRYVVRDPPRLRNILGSGMSNKMWDALLEHAKTCVLGGKLYVYYNNDPQAQGVGVIFNDIYEFSGLIASGQFFSSDSLSDSQKVYADTLVKKAYENWMHVVEYDSKSFFNLKRQKGSGGSVSQSEALSQHNPNAFGHHLALPSFPAEQQQPSIQSTVKPAGGFNNTNMTTRYSLEPQNTNLNGFSQSTTVSLPQDQLNIYAHQVVDLPTATARDNHNTLSLGPSLAAGYHQPIESSYQGIDALVTEELRMRSHEMLEHDDMQHLLRVFSMGGHGYAATPNVNDGYHIPYAASSTYLPSPSFNYSLDEDRSKSSSGKAVVGWLKLKAALRWGIFIRKRAAERRAQLTELDDT